ncbi:MAG: D-inositol-3-phosphate glycosyltransferase [Candidatus Argoarchaeum ethanivorans]|uniref:D-inositol-3-phosphate glycosyltransferase n=1 Tax=Candidatus Argoarchaeum ethanivorans TaxID=2608793 RepID=A0A811T410_9EURY|nr:MAG: D-inositol-3-phosphate glycosyltransferase [Candidatus Argoarchaeum ethanivorans]
MEANACGIPVVASKTGGILYAVKGGISGVFADPTNPKDIADKNLYLINTLKEWKRGCIKYAKNFDVKKITESFKKLYKMAYNAAKNRANQ